MQEGFCKEKTGHPLINMAVLVEQRYGKDKVKLVKVTTLPSVGASAQPHLKKQVVTELIVKVLLSGKKFEDSYTKADNSLVVPTDTVKNTIYFLAKKSPSTLENIEGFARDLIVHFLGKYAHVDGVHVSITTNNDWQRMPVTSLEPLNSKPFSGTAITSLNAKTTAAHPHSFVRGGETKRFTHVDGFRKGEKVLVTISSGVKDLTVLKSSGSSFTDFHQCELTTLPPMSERVLSTDVECVYRFAKNLDASKVESLQTCKLYETVKQVTLDFFANHDSPSVQNTLFRMGEKVLSLAPDLVDISYSLPNKHVFTYDLKRFGVENKVGESSVVLYPVADPSGLIVATIGRASAKL